jgi:stringent starvation protein B
MKSNQPYLLRAFYEWIVDNNLTPYLVVDANYPGTQVPDEHVLDGQIILNISPASTGKLKMGNIEVTFNARFGGIPRNLVIPCKAVLAIYAKENGAGTVFTAEDDPSEESMPAEVSASEALSEEPSVPKKGKPTLTVVK